MRTNKSCSSSNKNLSANQMLSEYGVSQQFHSPDVLARISHRLEVPLPLGADHFAQVVRGARASGTTGGKAEVPSLDKEGWLRPLRKCREASLAGADGVVGSSHRLSEVERTTPAAPPKERDHLLDAAATPPLPRRGLRLSLRLSQTPVSSGRLVDNDQRLGGDFFRT